MAINFPSTAGQLTDGSFTYTTGGRTWAWDGVTWESVGIDSTGTDDLAVVTNRGATTNVQLNLDAGFVSGGTSTFTGGTSNLQWSAAGDSLKWGDGAVALFGAGDDLAISHTTADGNRIVALTGLEICSDAIALKNQASSSTLIEASEGVGGTVKLYQNNVAKVTVTNLKTTISNTLEASGLTYPSSDGLAGEAIITDGSGGLSFGTFAVSETLDSVSDRGSSTNQTLTVGGLILGDTHSIVFGTGSDLTIVHTGSRSQIKHSNAGNPLSIESAYDVNILKDGTSDLLAKFVPDGEVKLYHSATERLATTATGITVNGVVTASGGTSTNWNTAYGWGDHSQAGYLTSITGETDPVFVASAAYNITSAKIVDWDAAVAWGDHANGGYVSLTALSITAPSAASGTGAISYNSNNGQFTYTPPDLSNYLTSYTETSTLANVIARGSTSNNSATIGGNGTTGGITIADGLLSVRTGTGNVASIDLYCEVSNAHKVSVKAPAHANFSGNINFTLPASHGTADQVLRTDGSGNTSWANVAANYTEVDTLADVTGRGNTTTTAITVGDLTVSSGNSVAELKLSTDNNNQYNVTLKASSASQLSGNTTFVFPPSNGSVNQVLATDGSGGTSWKTFSHQGGGVPTNTIAMWSGSVASIPIGWQLCDGTNGTPDLRDKFVVGVGTLYNPGDTGGSADAVVVQHSHGTNIDGGHVIPGNGGSTFPYGGAGTYSSTVFSMNDEGVSGTNQNLPPYFALCYIICTSTAGSGGGGGASVTVNDNAPTSPSSGDLWWNSDAGQLKIYYNDGSSSQWVDAAGGGGGSGGGVSIYNSMANYPTASTHEGQLAYASDINAMHYSDGSGWVGQRIVTTDDTTSSDFDTLLGNFEKTYTLSAVEHTAGTTSENSARKIIKLVDNSANDAGKFTLNVGSGLTSTLTTDTWSNTSLDLGLSLGSIHNYTLSAEINAGPNATDLRLGDSVRSISNNIKFAGADGLSIERTDANTITFRQGGGSVTQYTDAMAKDAAWAAISGGTHQNITFTYDSTNKFISANSSGSGGGGGGVTYDLQGRNTTSSNAFIDLVPSNGATDSIEFTGSGGTDVSWDSANNKITINTHNYAVGSNAAASGSGGIALVSGTLTYTPPDLSNFLTSVPQASATVLGGIKVGANLTIDAATGVLSANAGSYTLPTAGTGSGGQLGGVKVDGSTITINGSGVISSSGGSTVPSIEDVNATSTSIANNDRGDLTIVGHKGYVLYKIQSSHEAWIRLYVDAATRTADATRSEGADPAPGSGVIAEVRTSGPNQSVLITPGVMGFNNNNPRDENIYVSINNRSGSAATIQVTLTVLKIGE